MTCFTCQNCEVPVIGQQSRCDGEITLPPPTQTTSGIGGGTTASTTGGGGLPTFPGPDTTNTPPNTPGLPTNTPPNTPGLPTFPGQDATPPATAPTNTPPNIPGLPTFPPNKRKRDLSNSEYWTRDWRCYRVVIQSNNSPKMQLLLNKLKIVLKISANQGTRVNRGCVRFTGTDTQTCFAAARGRYEQCNLCEGNLCNNSGKLQLSIFALALSVFLVLFFK